MSKLIVRSVLLRVSIMDARCDFTWPLFIAPITILLFAMGDVKGATMLVVDRVVTAGRETLDGPGWGLGTFPMIITVLYKIFVNVIVNDEDTINNLFILIIREN